MRALYLFVAATAFAGGASAGCARGESAEQRQLNEMRDEISRVQSDRDRIEQRMSALEVSAAGSQKVASASGALPASGAAPQAIATPQLRIVRVNPDGTGQGQPPDSAAGSADEDPDDNAPRPTIRVAGTPDRRADARRTQGFRATDGIQLVGDTPNAGVRPSAIDPDAKRAYDAALSLVMSRQYPQALDAFAAFLVKWPDHPFADNALYWRGEAYFAQGDFTRAADQFEGVVARFPLGNKVPDALLKLGLCQQKLGNPERAKSAFERLTREFPRSEAARRVPAQEKP